MARGHPLYPPVSARVINDILLCGDPRRFEPLLGLYEVKSVLTTREGDNPVGGKWTRKSSLAQRLFRTRGTFQHLLPVNSTGLSAMRLRRDPNDAANAEERGEVAVAEAINVVSLDALDGSVRATVILRGDAVPLSIEERTRTNANRTITPLSDLAVRAHFDPPRIYFGRRDNKKKWGKKSKRVEDEGEYTYLPLELGPSSSVVLDTTYFDEGVRVGMGGTSGTRFVFESTTVDEASEYESLLARRSEGNRAKVLLRMAGIMAASIYVAFGGALGTDALMGVYASKLARVIANLKIATAPFSVVKRMVQLASVGAKLVAGLTSVLSATAILLLLFSSGGIERDRSMTRRSS